MNITSEPYGRLAALSGEIDLSTVGEVEERLEEGSGDGRPDVVVLDLREVSFLDSSGLRLVLRLQRQLSEEGRRLVVVQGPRRVARVFELTGVAEQLEVVADPSEI